MLASTWLGSSAGAGEDPEPTAAVAPWSAADLARRFPDPDKGADGASTSGAGFSGTESSGMALSGTGRCVECHEERRESLSTSFHAGLLGADGADAEPRTAAHGCEACHGPGAAHASSDGVEPIRHPWDAPAKEMIGVCLKCHAGVLEKPIRGHREWTADPARTEVRACTTCHEVHIDKAGPAHAESTGPFADIAALAKVADGVPAARCIGCHGGFHPEMKRSGHSQFLTEGDECGTCHGDGSLHEASGGRARLIVNPARQKARDADKRCNACHDAGAIVQRWTCSEHAKEGTSCITCHDANAARGRTLRKSEYELCGGCHLDVKASFRLPNGHRVARGRVLCSDCHDPHDNPRRVRNRDVRLRSCAKCHFEKAGPFVHDHGIKRTEGCIACHAPHGSVNDRMLTFRRMKQQCLQCHPGTSHDLSKRRYDNCIACHIEIHGSDVDRLFLR